MTEERHPNGRIEALLQQAEKTADLLQDSYVSGILRNLVGKIMEQSRDLQECVGSSVKSESEIRQALVNWDAVANMEADTPADEVSEEVKDMARHAKHVAGALRWVLGEG